MNEPEQHPSHAALLELFRIVNQVDMPDSDRTDIKNLAVELAHLKFCQGYDAARDFYRTNYELRLLPCKQAIRTHEETVNA